MKLAEWLAGCAWWALARLMRIALPKSSRINAQLCAEVAFDGSTVGWIERKGGWWIACSGQSRYECVSLDAAVFYLRMSAKNR